MTPAAALPAATAAAPERVRPLRGLPAAPPAPPPIVRHRLLARLAGAAPSRVVLLVAPAGYGKTTVLETWAAADPRPVHWLRTGRDDAAPSAVAALAEAFADPAAPAVAIVDGDRLGRQPAAAAALARLAEAVPLGSLLVLSTRGATLRQLARLRAGHALLELGPRDLAMTRGETASLLDRTEPGRDAPTGPALAAALEGWPAVLALAGDALGERTVDATTIAQDPHVAAYVEEEVLARLPQDLHTFLRRCSVADDLEPELCDAMLGGPGARAALGELARWGVPMARTDTDRPARCHPLLRAVLRAELERREPALAERLRVRGAAWLEDRGRTDEAIELLLAAEALDDAATLLWRLAGSWAWDGRVARLEQWLTRVPVRQVERHAALAGIAAVCELVRGRYPHSRRWTSLAEHALPGLPVALRRSVQGGVELLAALTAPPGARSLGASAATAGRLLPEDDPWRPLACLVGGLGATFRGDVRTGRGRLEAGVRQGMVGATGAAALCEAVLALTALCDGDWDDGACRAERARGRLDGIDLGGQAVFGLVVAVAAFSRAHRGRFQEARDDLALVRHGDLDPAALPPWWAIPTAVATGRAQLRVSELAGGGASLRAAARAAADLPDAPLLRAWATAAGAQTAADDAELPELDTLTMAELRVLRFLPSHLSFREIAARLYVSPNTVKTQVHAVYRKLGASSRSTAVARAARLGLVDQDTWTSPASDDAVARERA